MPLYSTVPCDVTRRGVTYCSEWCSFSGLVQAAVIRCKHMQLRHAAIRRHATYSATCNAIALAEAGSVWEHASTALSGLHLLKPCVVFNTKLFL